MLVRREGETPVQLLIRLDLAIARADIEDVFTDVLNPSNCAPLDSIISRGTAGSERCGKLRKVLYQISGSGRRRRRLRRRWRRR
jgi:hypothetical protein